MNLRILIIEDEQLGMERLEKHLLSFDSCIDIAGTADSVCSSIEWLNCNSHPDLIITDIDLGDGQSFDIFKEIPVDCPVVFTTCYDEYALNAFKSNDIDYLLKPIKKEDLLEVVNKFCDPDFRNSRSKVNIEVLVTSLQQQFKPKEFRQRFLVKSGKQLTSIETSEISYFYFDGKVNYVKTKDKRKLVVDHSLEELEQVLNPKLYFRANSFYIIALSSVTKINDYDEGNILLTLAPASEAKTVVPRHKVREFKVWIANSEG